MKARPRIDIQYGDAGEIQAAVGPGAGLAFVKQCFPEAADELIIATAYFSVKGYDLARRHIPERCRIHVLVGKRDGIKVQEAVLSEIRRELRHVTGPNVYAAVEDIRNRLRTGRFRIAAARRMEKPFHCKFYISHSELAWHGSANFSASGLKGQAEQGQLVRDPEHIARWKNWFLEVAAEAEDLRHDLIATLDEWLELAAPFDVYLKALVHLLEAPELRRELDAFEPVYFQKHLAAWALHQLDEYGGALLVVATGLGKTVIGAEIAGFLAATEEIEHVVLLAPRAVHSLWNDQLYGRRVPYTAFDNTILFKRNTGKIGHKVTDLCSALDNANERTLVLIDEAHFYRNQLLKHAVQNRSMAIDRIGTATQQGARIVMLTGSVYGTSVQNLNSLLYLLPHCSSETLYNQGPWEASSYDRFNTLPPTAVLGYPHVLEMARQRGDIDGGKPFVNFGQERKYLPSSLDSRLIRFDLALESEVASAFGSHYFDQARKMPTICFSDEEGIIKTMTDTVYNVTLQAWLSSPQALADCIEENLQTEGTQEDRQLFDVDGGESTHPEVPRDLFGRVIRPPSSPRKKPHSANGYSTILQRDLASRRRDLQSLLGGLKKLRNKPDNKADQLIAILKQRRDGGPLKAIVFVERLVTACYLDRLIRSRVRSLNVTSTVSKNGELKDRLTRTRILSEFAPEAHGRDLNGPRIEVLICTDADGVGVNLQDSDTVINYDLTLGADQLVQRLGRILRATSDSDRSLRVYTFIPACIRDSKRDARVYRRIRIRYDRLFDRHEKSGEILGSRILPSNDHKETIPFEGDVDIGKLFKALDPLTIPREERSPAAHLSILEKHLQRAGDLSHTLHSMRTWTGSEPRLIVVFRHRGKIHAVTFDPVSKEIISEETTAALNLLACPTDAPLPHVLKVSVPNILDAAAEAALHWCVRHQFSPEEIERLATLYLIPESTTLSPQTCCGK